MARDLSLDDGKQEDNLLIEAVSLLVQRQRETESWVAEQIEHAEQRTSAAERHYTDLEDRLAGIELQLDRLVHDLEPGRGDPATGQRLARLREQVADLRSDTDGRPLRSVPPPPSVREAAPTEAPPPPPPTDRDVEPAQPRPVAAAAATPTGASTLASVWELFGNSREDRFGLLLIFFGIVGVLYAALSLFRLV